MIFTASMIPFMIVLGAIFIFGDDFFDNTKGYLSAFVFIPAFMFAWVIVWSLISDRIALRKINKKLAEQNGDEV